MAKHPERADAAYDVKRAVKVGGSPERLIALSDGIFGVALTLLVLDIPVPDTDGTSISTAVREALPHVSAAGFSFAVIAAFWRDHRRTFLWVGQVDTLVIRLTLAGLFAVSLIPFPTALLSRYGAETLSVAIYAGAMVLMNLLQLAVFTTVWRRDHLQTRRISADVGQSVMMDLGTSIAIFGASIVIAFISPVTALFSWLLLLPLKLAFGWRERRARGRAIA